MIEGLCQRCKLRPATAIWSESGVLGYVHGLAQRWCNHCVLDQQIAHAEQMLKALPELRAARVALDKKP